MWPLQHTQVKKLTTDDAQRTMEDGHSTITIAHSELNMCNFTEIKQHGVNGNDEKCI